MYAMETSRLVHAAEITEIAMLKQAMVANQILNMIIIIAIHAGMFALAEANVLTAHALLQRTWQE
jgi:hypothetical protein